MREFFPINKSKIYFGGDKRMNFGTHGFVVPSKVSHEPQLMGIIPKKKKSINKENITLRKF